MSTDFDTQLDITSRKRYKLRMPLPLAEFEYGGIHLLGSSLAGEESFVVVPSLNLAFDVGRAPREVVNVDHVFLTHGHMDHAAGVAYYFGQRKFLDNEPGHLYLPRPLVAPVRNLLRTWAEIDHEPPANVHAAEPGTDIALRRDLIVRPFTVRHPSKPREGQVIQGLGYAAIEVRKKLRPEYQGLSGPQLVELKQKGVDITLRKELPLIAYCGDTAPGDFVDLDYVRNAKILLMECTFVAPDHLPARPRRLPHTHHRPARCAAKAQQRADSADPSFTPDEPPRGTRASPPRTGPRRRREGHILHGRPGAPPAQGPPSTGRR